MCSGGLAWYANPPTQYYEIQLVNARVVHILLECILVEESMPVQSVNKVLYGATPCKEIH